jgi:SAM-dependent methyltransferase
VIHADAAALPFLGEVFDAAVAVNVLDHLPDPTVAISEVNRILALKGSFLAATASRRDSPELAHVWRRLPTSFDAEDGPRLVASVSGQVQVERWDTPLVRLPDRDAVRDCLIAWFVPSASPRRLPSRSPRWRASPTGRPDLCPQVAVHRFGWTTPACRS